MFTKKLGMMLCLLVCIAILPAALAQDDDSCTTVVKQALEVVDSACEGVGRNQACYGNPFIDVELQPDVETTFAQPGDITALASIGSLHTAPLDMQTGDWGIALMKVQANLPDTMPGQNVTFLLTGDVTLTDVSAEMDTAPMQAFYFTTGIGETACQNAPNSLVIQSPSGTKVALTVNGTDISLGSTAVLEITPAGNMDVLLVGGMGEVTAAGTSENVPAGQMTTVELGDDGLAATAPSTATTYDATRIQYVPLNLLPETVTVPATVAWVDTGIELQTGQTFTISASGMVNTHAVDDEFSFANVWLPPAGFASGNCSAEMAEILPGCACVDTRDVCPILDVTVMALVGRVGDSEPFVVGPGGTFTAANDGMLFLAVNDSDLSDNAGAFTVIITVQGEAAVTSPGPSGDSAVPANCTVSTAKTANLRSGPGTNYTVAGQLAPGTSIQVAGQAQGADGFMWWQLVNNSWARSDVVNESGNCDAVPEVTAP